MSHPSTSAETTPRSVPANLATVTRRNVALVGPPMVGKTGTALDTLRRATDEGRDALLVSTARGADRLDVPADVSVVDCTPGDSPSADASVNSPAELTGISMPVSRFLDGATRPVVVIDSLSSLLLYGSEREVFRFLTVLSTQISQVDGLGLSLVDEGAHETQTVRTFAQQFDGQVKLQDAAGGVEARARGVETLPAEWVPARD